MELNSYKCHVTTYRTKSFKERKWWWIRYGRILSFWEIIVTNRVDSDSSVNYNYSGLMNSFPLPNFLRFGQCEECSNYVDLRHQKSCLIQVLLLDGCDSKCLTIMVLVFGISHQTILLVCMRQRGSKRHLLPGQSTSVKIRWWKCLSRETENIKFCQFRKLQFLG